MKEEADSVPLGRPEIRLKGSQVGFERAVPEQGLQAADEGRRTLPWGRGGGRLAVDREMKQEGKDQDPERRFFQGVSHYSIIAGVLFPAGADFVPKAGRSLLRAASRNGPTE